MRRIYAVVLCLALACLLNPVSSQDSAATADPVSTQDITPSSEPTLAATVPVSDLPTEAQPPVETPTQVIPPTAETTESLPAPTEASASPAPTLPVADISWRLSVRELFDTLPQSPWTVPSDWALTQERLTAQTNATAAAPLRYETALANVQAQGAFVLGADASASLAVRVSDSGAYRAVLRSTGDLSLLRGETLVAQTALTLAVQESHTLLLSAFEDRVIVQVDDQPVLSYSDAAPLPAGAVEFGGEIGAALALDDVFLWQPASEITPVPDSASVPVIPTVSAPTALPATPEEQAAPASSAGSADGEVSAQGGTLPLDTPTQSTLVQNPNGQSYEDWVVYIPSGVNYYTIEIEAADPDLEVYFGHTIGNNIAPALGSIFTYSNSLGFVTTGYYTASPTYVTIRVYTGWKKPSAGKSGNYTITVYSDQRLTIPYKNYTATSNTSGMTISGNTYDSFWEFTIPATGDYYLNFYVFESTSTLVYNYQIKSRDTGTVVASGQTSTPNPYKNPYSTMIKLSGFAPGLYDLTLVKVSGAGAYFLGLYPIPPAPANLHATNRTKYNVSFAWDADSTGSTEKYDIYVKNPQPTSSSFYGSWLYWATVDANVTSYSVTGVQCNLSFAVMSWNAATDGITSDYDNYVRAQVSTSETISTLPCPPSNDKFTQAVTLNTFPYTFTSSTNTNYLMTSAEDTAGDPPLSCAPDGYTASIWYRYTPTTNQILEVNTIDSTYDTVIGIYQLVNGKLVEKACHDDLVYSQITTSQLIYETTANQTYYILLSEWGQFYPLLTDVLHAQFKLLTRPATPTLLTPSNNATVNTTNNLLTWNSVPNAASYHVQVSATTTFATRLTDKYVNGTQYDPNQDIQTDGKYYWRVNAVTSGGLEGSWSTIWAFTRDTAAPAAPVIAVPAANAVLTTLRPTFALTAVTGAVRYEWQAASDNAFTSPVTITPSTSTTTTLALTQSLAQGQYYVRVRACDAATNCGDYSAVRPFRVDLRVAPAANATVILPLATTGLALTWTVPAGVTSFNLQVSSDVGFTSPYIKTFSGYPVATPPTTWTIANASTTLGGFGTYYWRLVLTGLTDVNSPVRSFILTPPVPAAPRFNAQPNGGLLNTATAALSWQAVTYTPSALTYEVQVDDLTTFASPNDSAQGITGLNQTTNTLPDGVYYARVRAVNAFGGAGPWSTSLKFTLDTTPPAAPVITVPYANAWMSSARQPISWKAVPGAVRYFIQYSAQGDFLDTPMPVNVDIAAAAAPIYTPTVSLRQGVYTVRVWAKDAAGNEGNYSTVVAYTFTVNKTPVQDATTTLARPIFTWALVPGATQYQVVVDDNADCQTPLHTSAVLGSAAASYTYPATSPSAPALTYGTYYWCVAVNRGAAFGNTLELPPAGFRFTVSPSVPPAVTILYPLTTPPVASSQTTVQWTDVPAATVGGPFTYQVQVDDNALFNGPEFDGTTADATASILTSALADGKYNVRVRVVNSYGGVSAWSAVRAFSIDTVAPDIPTLTAPTQEAVLTTLTPTITWNAVTGASGYLVQLSHTPNFTPRYEKQVTTTSLVVPFALLNQMYYVRIKSLDIAGNESVFSPTRVFTVQWPTTLAPIPLLYTVSTPTLTWEGVTPWALRYEVQVSANSTFTQLIETLITTDTSFDVTPRVDGVYYWRVRAGIGTSQSPIWYAWSDVITFAVDS